MSEEYSKDRLQPSLLDRLTDYRPDARTESPDERVLTHQQLRAAVLRDLSWLFSTTRHEPSPSSTRRAQRELWANASFARRSVLNFGLPPFPGAMKSGLNRAAMQTAIKQAIADFEPRIDAETVQVEIGVSDRLDFNALKITIRGELWAKPVSTPIQMTTDFDTETGQALVREARK